VRHAFSILLALAAGLALAFLMLPIVAIFARVPLGDLAAGLGSGVVLDALWVSVRTSLIANAIIVMVGTPAAYLLATRRFPGRRLVVTLIELPLVLPPAVAGIGLLAAFGRSGLLGDELAALGVTIPFTQLAVVLAVLFVASPFYLRQAVAAFESVDRELLDASRTLGAGPGRTFRRVALPLASGGLAAGGALAFARGIGEFGATIIFAGNFEGVTQTLPLAIYSQLDRDFDAALAIGGLLVVFSAGVLLSVKLLPSWTRTAFGWTYRSPSGTSSSGPRSA
jgi:molybdate transport system permease protein